MKKHFLFLILSLMIAQLSTAQVRMNVVKPKIDITQIVPMEGNYIVYQRVAPFVKTGKATAQLSVKLNLRNRSGKTLNVQKIQFLYKSNGNKIKTFTTLGRGINTHVDTIPPNATRSWQNSRDYHEKGDVVFLNQPFPTSLTIKVYCKGYNAPVVLTRKLKGHLNANPALSFDFPAKVKDLRINEYWTSNGLHGGGSQVFGLDLVAKAWDGSKWTHVLPGKSGKKNNHFRVYGKPVYAMADGIVIGFKNNHIENPNPPKKINKDKYANWSGAGNHFYVKHGNEVVLYAHFIPGSLNKSLMKKGAKVKKGQYLAKIGNSGSSTGPHLHMHAYKDVSGKPFRPMNFHNAQIIAANKLPKPNPNGPWVKLAKKTIPPLSCLIWPSDSKVTWYPSGWKEFSRHGISAAQYQTEFNKITSSGYYPVWIDGYNVNGKTYFNAIFKPKNGTPWVARHNLSGSSYQKEFDKWVKGKKYRLQMVDSYISKGQVRYAAVFVKKAGPVQAAYHGISAKQHQQKFDSWTKNGWVPVNVSVVSVGGKKSYIAFYEKKKTNGLMLKSSLTAAQYQQQFTHWADKGMKLVYLNAYTHNGQPYFSAIWYGKSSFKNFPSKHHLSGSGYQTQFNKWTGQGFCTNLVTGYEYQNKAAFAGSWIK
ncbi:MAG: peptidoglycan DD-metalloendopeptidase family protein [Bacteroidota bacterium]